MSKHGFSCQDCGKVVELELSQEQIDRYNSGVLAQNAFPHLTPDEREIIISGICGECFDNMFARAEEDYGE